MNKDNLPSSSGRWIYHSDDAICRGRTISKLEKKIAEFKSVTYALEHEHTQKMMEDLLGDMDM